MQPSLAIPNLVEATKLDHDIDDKATVVIIGTGAGGPAAAYELARAGVDVIMVEEGSWFPPEFYRDLKPVDAFKYLYRDFGMTAALGRRLTKDPTIPFPLGKCVGGTTTVNSGTCFRTPEKLIDLWNRELGLGIDLAALNATFDEVEQIVHAQPVPDEALGQNSRIFGRGSHKLGWGGQPLVRNADGCRGSGRCVFGCPSNAKRGTHLSYVPLALMHGARLYSDLRVERIIQKHGQITAVEGVILDRDKNRPKGQARIAADVVIVAAGAIGTPTLLQRNNIARGNPWLGENLRLHPGIRVCADFDEKVNGWKGVPQGYYVDRFWNELGIMFEGIFVPPGFAIPILPGVGAELRRRFERYPNLAAFGAMVKDTSTGSVRPLGKNSHIIRYSMNDIDKTNLVNAVKRASEVFFAAGANEVYPAIYGHAVLKSVDDVAKIDPKRVKTQHLEPMAFHPMGTARMAADRRLGVVDPQGKVYGTDNLYVADGSLFPTCLGVNPMESIMGFAHQIARGIHGRL